MTRRLPTILLGLVLAACNGDALAPAPTVRLVGVTPAGGSVGVPTDAAIVLAWDHAMRPGMEAYVALHRDSLRGPQVSMTCAWSADATTLTCTPDAPLAPGTHYALHVGGGMHAADGGSVDMDPGMGMGGDWVMGTMGGGGMGGMGGGGMGSCCGADSTMMGDGWRHHGNGSYGMVFEFTTS